jgi:hypothetical protein
LIEEQAQSGPRAPQEPEEHPKSDPRRPRAEKMQNERVKSKPPSLGFGFDMFLIKSSRPKVNEIEDSMSN